MTHLRKQKSKIISGRSRGMTIAKLAEEFGVSNGTMHKFLLKAKLNTRKSLPTFFGEIGTTFNGWTIVDNRRCGYMRRFVLCACECGKIKRVEIRYLKEGLSRRCRPCSARRWMRMKKSTLNGN
jgi:hypothetical protein